MFMFSIGGLIGETFGILFSARLNKKSRQNVTTEAQDMMNKAVSSIREAQDTALAAIKDTQSRMDALSQETKDRLTKLQEIAEHTFDEQKQSIQKGYSNARKVVKE